MESREQPAFKPVHPARFEHRHLLTAAGAALMGSIIGNPLRYPDLVIAPDGNPYLYRWHIVRSDAANIYFHIQVSDDPERPLHDHPWDNFSTILSGGYDELHDPAPWLGDNPRIPELDRSIRQLRAGITCTRKAEEAHRLLLPKGIPYTMTLFSTGPKRRTWGFWYPEGFRPFDQVTRLLEDGRSIHIKPEG